MNGYVVLNIAVSVGHAEHISRLSVRLSLCPRIKTLKVFIGSGVVEIIGESGKVSAESEQESIKTPAEQQQYFRDAFRRQGRLS